MADFSLGGVFYFNLSFSLLRLLYFLTGSFCLLFSWKKPFIKPRLPVLVLITALGFVIN